MFHLIILYSSATLWFFVTDVRTGIHTTSIPWLAGKDISGRTAPSYAKQPRCHWPQTSSGRCAPIGEHLPWVRRHGMSPLIGGWCVSVRALPPHPPKKYKKPTPVGGCAMRRIQNPKISQVGSSWNILAAPWDPHLGTSPLPAVSHQRLHQVREWKMWPCTTGKAELSDLISI